MASHAREPAVPMLFAGFLLASTLLAARPDAADPADSADPDRGPEPAARIPEALRAGSAAPDAGRARSLDTLCARELRALPGIGPARAIAIASARWDHALSAGPSNDPGAFGSVRGIGPETVRTLRAYLEAMTHDPTSPDAAPDEVTGTTTGGTGPRR